MKPSEIAFRVVVATCTVIAVGIVAVQVSLDVVRRAAGLPWPRRPTPPA